MSNVLISGAGIAGLCMARQLKKIGIGYTIIEKKAELSVLGTGIALPANAVRALRYLGLSDAVDTMHQVTDIIYSRPDGRILSQASLLESPLNLDKFVALDRGRLLSLLQEGLAEEVHCNVTITSLNQQKNGVEVNFSNPALNGHYQAVIGADGLHSVVRELGFGQPALDDLGVTNWRWVCDYPTQNLQPTYMLGKQNIFLAYPMGSNKVYCYAHQADAGAHYYKPDAACKNIKHLLAQYQGIARTLLGRLPDNNAIYTGRLRSVPEPLFQCQDLALIGDAGNACSPMLQQGAAAAFEDAIVLSELMAHFPIRQAFELYESQRSPRVNWSVKTSDNSIKSFIKINSRLGIMARNWMIKRKGPLNVAGWRYLFSQCPLNNLAAFIAELKKESV